MYLIKDGWVVDTDPYEGELEAEPVDYIMLFVGPSSRYEEIPLLPDARGYVYIWIDSDIFTNAGCKDGDKLLDATEKIRTYIQQFDTLIGKRANDGGF